MWRSAAARGYPVSVWGASTFPLTSKTHVAYLQPRTTDRWRRRVRIRNRTHTLESAMNRDLPLGRIGLRDAVEALRKELSESILAGADEELRLQVGEVTLHFERFAALPSPVP
jgi:hypothetical protein